jgi:hypothetical protein
MRKISSTGYGLFLICLIGLLGGITLAKGGLYVDRYEGDVAHLIDILLRIDAGLIPHRDMSTPIGIAAFYPIVLFVKLGLGVGLSFVSAQMLIAALLAPMVLRTAVSRLSGLSAWMFGIVVISIVLALVHGEAVASQSVSMYYNRWGWAMSFVAILLAALPAHEGAEKPRLDGIIIGVLLAVLALLKPTYFVAFSIPISIALLLRGAWLSLGFAFAAGTVVALCVALGFGVEFYAAYVRDLLSVAQSPTRSAPGAELVEVLNGPRFLIATLVLVLSVIVLRQGGQGRAGLILLLLAPGFVYVTYQNFGNDPKWLLLLCIYLMAHRPVRGTRVIFNADARNACAALSLVCFALIAPSFQNMITSPLRHFGVTETDYQLQLETTDVTRDVWVYSARVNKLRERTNIVDRIPALAAYDAPAEDVTTFMGAALPECQIYTGDALMHAYMADLLKDPPFNYGPRAQFFVADVATVIWMEGGFAPLKGGAPWYYSGTPGIDNAEAIIVPLCPVDMASRKAALEALSAADLNLGAPIRTEVMVVYPINK